MRSIIYMIVALMPLTSQAIAQTNNSQRQQLEPRGFLYGIGVISNQEVYQGFGQRTVPIPMIGYRGERLTVFGPFVSYDVVQQDGWRLSARLAPRFAGTEESDSDVFLGMAERKNSLDVGIGVQRDWQQWRFESSLMHDVLGNSNGYEVRNRVSYVYALNGFFIEPQVGLDYADSALTDYYYGVREDEATITRPAYQAESVWNYSVGLAVMTPRYFGGMTRLSIEHRWFGDSIDDSPLTDRNTGVQVFLSYSRFFQ